MSLRDWFAAKKKATAKLNADGVNKNLSDSELKKIWVQCYSCQANLKRKALAANLHVCPECNYHFRIGSKVRLEQLMADERDTFLELNANLTPADPLNFADTQPYRQRQSDAFKKSQLKEAVTTGVLTLHSDNTPEPEQLAIGVMDFAFMGGSMGSVVGEKLTCLAELALANRLPLAIFSSSGGARMQEGTLSLMQMVKTGSALAKLHDAGLLYMSVLTEPTFGGVTASFGTLGDIIIAEKGARIGFAGRRVIEQTIRQKLPPDFQTAGYLMDYGQVDRVVERPNLRDELLKLMVLHRKASGIQSKAVTADTLPLFETQATKVPKPPTSARKKAATPA